MSALSGTAVPAPLLRRRISDVLRDITVLCHQCGYDGYRFVLVGRHPSGDPFHELRIPCPEGEGTVEVADGRTGGEPVGWDGITAFLRREFPDVVPDTDAVTLLFDRPGQPTNTFTVRLNR